MTANTLRLSALVAAAMTSGYLWRAAVDLHAPETLLQATPAAAIGFELPDAPFSSLERLREPSRRASVPVRKARPVVRRNEQRSDSRASAATQLIAVVQTRPASPAQAKHSSRRAVGKHASRPATPPPGQPPRPAPPPPPVPQPPPPVNPPAPPPPPPPPPPVREETRPGRGKGDKHHSHSGPPGQAKRKKEKGQQGGTENRSSGGDSGERKEKKAKK
ncbi:MAG: hypothetical protein ABI896_08395 [Actinomycetota bacterium]